MNYEGFDPNYTRYFDIERMRPVAVCPHCRVVASFNDFRRWNSEAVATLAIRLVPSNHFKSYILCSACRDLSHKRDRAHARIGSTPISEEQRQAFSRYKPAPNPFNPVWTNWSPPVGGRAVDIEQPQTRHSPNATQPNWDCMET